MFLGKEVIGNPIINRKNGRQIGQVQDLYLDEQLRTVAGIYVGSEGLFNSTPKWIAADNVAAISQDTVLVENDSIVTDELNDEEQPWIRRDDLQGRPVDTTGATKVGRIGDVILNDQAQIVGFSLSRVYVQGPIADRRALRRLAVRDLGHEDGGMTISLTVAEQQDLRVIDKIFFGQEVTEGAETDDTGKSPYTDEPDPDEAVSHSETSPYVAGQATVPVEDRDYRSPYTTPEPAPADADDDTFKSPYTTAETSG